MVSYVAVFRCDRSLEVEVGALGVLRLKPGYYYYVGSAKSGMHRVLRHFRKGKKKRWHIDYLSEILEAVGAIIVGLAECELAACFADFESIPRFGCSDCGCESHLFYSQNLTLDFLST